MLKKFIYNCFYLKKNITHSDESGGQIFGLCSKMGGTQRFTYLIFKARRDKKGR